VAATSNGREGRRSCASRVLMSRVVRVFEQK
jgi:hypothetical protein